MESMVYSGRRLIGAHKADRQVSYSLWLLLLKHLIDDRGSPHHSEQVLDHIITIVIDIKYVVTMYPKAWADAIPANECKKSKRRGCVRRYYTTKGWRDSWHTVPALCLMIEWWDNSISIDVRTGSVLWPLIVARIVGSMHIIYKIPVNYDLWDLLGECHTLHFRTLDHGD